MLYILIQEILYKIHLNIVIFIIGIPFKIITGEKKLQLTYFFKPLIEGLTLYFHLY